MKIDFDQIRELLTIVEGTDISELTIESAGEKITVKKETLAAHASPTVSAERLQAEAPDVSLERTYPAETAEGEGKTPAGSAADKRFLPITSPMVGTFYRSPSPNSPPFIELGDPVQAGQTVCIIEAMKLMNDLPSEVSGKVVKICAENGTTVEYGQTLFLLDPEG